MSDCWHSHNSWDGVNRKYYSGGYKASDEDDGNDTRFNYKKRRTVGKQFVQHGCLLRNVRACT